MIEDRILIWRFKRGSKDAFARIYLKYRCDLLKVAAALSNNISIAEDIVHDCFVSFAGSADTLKIEGNLKSYLATCVANRARNLNSEKSRRDVSLDACPPPSSELHRPDDWVIRTERLRILNEALSQLPYEQREVITLHLDGQIRFKAIARLQNVSVNTVQSRYRYGLDKLRSILNSEVIS